MEIILVPIAQKAFHRGGSIGQQQSIHHRCCTRLPSSDLLEIAELNLHHG
jgi:hypothetical protein